MLEISKILNNSNFFEIKEKEKLIFNGVGDKDVYNISKPIEFNGEKYLFGRVEPRNNSELSKVFLFKKNKGQWIVDNKFKPFEAAEDPFIIFLDNQIILGFVEVVKMEKAHDFDLDTKLDYRTVFYMGGDIYNLKRFFEGPWKMKDIRLVKLKDNKIGIFSRPQGKKGGRGKIGFCIVESLGDLNEKMLYGATLLDQFSDLEWGGANDVHLLNNGKIGVLGHIAKKNNDNSLFYYPMIFTLDPKSLKHSDIKILFTRDNLPSGNSKNNQLKNVIFPGGLIRKNENAEIYFGLGDAESYMVLIRDPFIEYES